ncbi:D-cysteine desulfhydrase [Sinobacterium norvegicum]|uniref:D-cysteine desulfhydrase n=1 Tax=Sinobacterium norvegicum TaxID=1641715 RepID=A0ABM9AH06_9GAMM|nr:pyridoxal-phosphate dependent enzyme [Sinobacterium norvegicum]CAH0992503.1 D-cysteine desulfhydrase [Sinobacterium norvegicum]
MHEELLEFAQTPVQALHSPLLTRQQLRLSVKRLDLLDHHISGNKWYKLKHNLAAAKAQNLTTVISFGGAYSNHIHALACAGSKLGLRTVGVIRGERIEPLNPTLADAERWGMELVFISREQYRHKRQPECLHWLQQRFGKSYIIPEGGANALAIEGCGDITRELACQLPDYDIAVVACGTAGTLAGMVAGAESGRQLLGIAVLKAHQSLLEDINRWLQGRQNLPEWQLLDGFHCGGYAKVDGELVVFCDQFERQFGITLEPIYSGKMFKALFALIEQGYFPPGSHIVAVHTGGLQGLRGMKPRLDKLRYLAQQADQC